MLHEIEKPRQIPEEGRRRWFTDEYFDLIIWYNDTGVIDGFQLCYDKGEKERALTWRRTGSCVHEAVDDGELYGRNKMTPVMVSDGFFNTELISRRFSAHPADMEPDLSSFILERLTACRG